MLKVPEVAKKLNCSIANVYALVEAGRLSHFRIGTGRGGIRITDQQMAEFLESARRGPGEAAPHRPRLALKHITLKPSSSSH